MQMRGLEPSNSMGITPEVRCLHFLPATAVLLVSVLVVIVLVVFVGVCVIRGK